MLSPHFPYVLLYPDYRIIAGNGRQGVENELVRKANWPPKLSLFTKSFVFGLSMSHAAYSAFSEGMDGEEGGAGPRHIIKAKKSTAQNADLMYTVRGVFWLNIC